MAGPSERDRVLKAIRFGWAFAELRGRMRMGASGPPSAPRPDHALPLGDERTWTEQTIEVGRVVAALAADMEVDFDLSTIDPDAAAGPVSTRLLEIERRLRNARQSRQADVDTYWHQACDLVYRWDAAIQDALAAQSFATASGYQLGRGLAETYWALDPTRASPDPRSWEFLLGGERGRQLDRLLTRLSDYLPTNGATAVRGSVAAWGQVAVDEILRTRERTYEALHEQVRVWHDVLVVGQAPSVRVNPRDIIKRASSFVPVLKAFLPESLVSAVSFVGAGIAVVLFAAGTHATWLAPIIAVASFFGLTSAGASAKLKTSAQSLVTGLRAAMDEDLVKQSVTLPPAQALVDVDQTRRERHRQEQALSEFRDAAESVTVESAPTSPPQLTS